MSHPSRVRVSGALEPYSQGFVVKLSQLGYTSLSAALQVRLMAHVSRWLTEERQDACGLSPAAVNRFLAARLAAGYTNHLSPKAMKPMLEYLRGLGVAPLPGPEQSNSPVEMLLERYRRYLTLERGLGIATARGYVDAARPFVAGRAGPSGLDLEQLTAGDVTAFVVARCPQQTRSPARLTVTALRSLLGFLHVDGILSRSLTAAVPSVAGWRLSGLPRGLEPVDVCSLLASCDRRTTGGRRDFAILCLLARLGLRAAEVAGLELDDLDWRAGELVVRGKGTRADRLPLPADVGEAMVGYLRRGRPQTVQGRAIFVRVKAPHRALTSGGVSQVVAAAGRRAGLGVLHAHRLRHTAATAMLRGGASLVEIGQLLRHRLARTTAIYAKVDREALRSLARPWPGGAA